MFAGKKLIDDLELLLVQYFDTVEFEDDRITATDGKGHDVEVVLSSAIVDEDNDGIIYAEDFDGESDLDA